MEEEDEGEDIIPKKEKSEEEDDELKSSSALESPSSSSSRASIEIQPEEENGGEGIGESEEDEENRNEQEICDDSMILESPSSCVCSICYFEVQEDQRDLLIQIPVCHHIFCPECLLRYLSNAIEETEVASLNCPGIDCEELLDENLIFEILSHDEKLSSKYLEVKEMSTLRENPNCRWCPRPGCGRGNIGETGVLEITCRVCNYKYCFECGQDFHPEQTCEEFKRDALKKGKLDKRAEAWKKKKKTKPCPQCKHDIEKDVGCNHMKCAKCHYQFCWLCLRKYTPDHYDADNWDNGCPNQCFDFVEPFPERAKKKAKKAALWTGIILGGIVVLAVAIPIGIVVGPFYGCYRYNRNRQNQDNPD